MPWYQGIANLLCQLVGSVLGACLLAVIFPCDQDLTTTLGTNVINPNYGARRVLVGEAFGTFLLCFTVWETAVTPQASCGKNACIAIGFAVFLAHVVLLPIDGCSINPTRSFGPAVVSKFRGCNNYTVGGLDDLWVMWAGPLIGAALAAVVQVPFSPDMAKLEEQQHLEKDDVPCTTLPPLQMATAELKAHLDNADFGRACAAALKSEGLSPARLPTLPADHVWEKVDAEVGRSEPPPKRCKGDKYAV